MKAVLVICLCLLARSVYGEESGEVTLNFPSTSAGACSELTVNMQENCAQSTGNTMVTGLGVSQSVAASATPGVFWAYVSGAGVTNIRFCNTGLISAVDPISGTFRVQTLRPEC